LIDLEGVYKVNEAHLVTDFSLGESLSDSPSEKKLTEDINNKV